MDNMPGNVMCTIFDKQAEVYGKPMEFENQKMAVASIRRDVRDMYCNYEVTLDRLRDEDLVFIGYFYPETGQLVPIVVDRQSWELYKFITPEIMHTEDLARYKLQEEKEVVEDEDDFPY